MPHESTNIMALARLMLLGVALVAAAIALLWLGSETLLEWFKTVAASRWGVIGFIAAYTLAVVLLVPGSWGTITAGLVFGFKTGLLISMTGATLGAMIAFVIGRGMGREGTQQLLGARFASIDQWLSDNDFLSVVALRLMPIVPFNALNYACGLTSIRPSRYVLGTIIGMAPGTIVVSLAAANASNPASASFVGAVTVAALVTAVSAVIAKRRYGSNRDQTSHAR